MDIWIATFNSHKIKELIQLSQILKVSLNFHSARDMTAYSAPVETGKTFEENALIKARSFKAVKPDVWVLAEDSGLVVEGLGGLPGIHSARYAGAKATDLENVTKLLKMIQLKGIVDKKAYFKCVLVVLSPQGNTYTYTGEMFGVIAEKPRGSYGFGYDPVFIPEGQTLTLAELGSAYKNQHSHRAKAFKAWIEDFRLQGGDFMNQIKLFAGSSNPTLARLIAQILGIPLGQANVSRFADGEVQVEIHESVRGEDVFLIQSTCPPTNENYMELFILIDALKRASPASITAVVPYYGYGRQDRKVASRAPITAKLMADLLTTSGIHRMVSVDLHAGQIQGFFNVPVDHLYAIPTLSRYWREHYGWGTDFVAVSPDAGGVERAKAFAKRIECSMAIIDKRRTSPNEAKALHLIGDVAHKTAIIVDDIIDTAGTLTQGVDILYKNGAKRVLALATHPVFSGPAMTRIKESPIEKVLVTDTIPLSAASQESNKIEVISIAPVLAEAIQRIHGKSSVSSLFE